MRRPYQARLLPALAGMIIAAFIAACQTGNSRAPGEPPPQLLTQGDYPDEPLASCGGRSTFVREALDGPVVDEAPGAEFDALRSALASLEADFRDRQHWRLVYRGGERLLLVGETNDGHAQVRLRTAGAGWRLAGAGECPLHTVLGSGIGAAQWWPDPRMPQPTAESTVLEIFVEELACSGGS